MANLTRPPTRPLTTTPTRELSSRVAGRGIAGDGPGIVSEPEGFDDYAGHAVVITRAGIGASSTFTTDFDFDATKPTPNGTIFVGPDGNNANDGLTYANRVRSLGTAITKANALAVAVVRIRAKPGHYWRYSGSLLSDHFAGVQPTCDLIIEPDNENGGAGDVYVWGNHGAAVTWAQQGATAVYKSTSFGNSAPVINIVDRANVDADGDPISLFRVLTVANSADPSPELAAAEAAYGRGAFYYNSTPNPDEAWVQLHGGRAPDSDVAYLSNSVAADQLVIPTTAKRRLWIDRLHIFGGKSALNVNAGASALHEVYARQCAFNAGCGSAGSMAWSDEGGTLVLDRCRASDGYLDGFNYHSLLSTTDPAHAPQVLEIQCKGSRNGQSGGGANNTSTAHEAARVISVECEFGSAQDRVIHDVGATKRWMLGGSVAAPIDTATTGVGCIRAGLGGADVSEIYLDAVTLPAVSGVQFHLSASGVSTKCITRNMSKAGLVLNGDGDLGAY